MNVFENFTLEWIIAIAILSVAIGYLAGCLMIKIVHWKIRIIASAAAAFIITPYLFPTTLTERIILGVVFSACLSAGQMLAHKQQQNTK